MTTTATERSTKSDGEKTEVVGQGRTLPAARAESAAPGAVEDRGKTTIADQVVAKIANLAAREVPGVHALGGGISRTLATARDRVTGSGAKAAGLTGGVKVEVGQLQAAVDLQLIVEYGVVITDVAAQVREDVVDAVERMTGLEVVEVNISVIDVRLLEEDDDQDGDGRVQ
ncbi:Asp23/Gls24 family envelope stress response protein [Catenulispora sp. NF23]|uniref:Asp23/Gls24 family envelope stress response protein n=1 Tax=Catenulispora pinistramenti TaxID=2705254 RepID=A0ABS5KNG6_9ACTN|nr:Asp23/Gls24 family envelope stress response protein [Catenulispora pinistramenti]MBS2532655.1 Asp23/Gls24 family envelope stress response protein [Catenulispora pinistramenti]MBS2547588.1 Asp23/Gls24 family envelope stress response protein [Catenulispora pinistramenti]